VQKKILIVEDEVLQRKVLSDCFAQNGLTILEASDGYEGLKIALDEHPDIIVTDVRMPKMDGMAMIHKLRGDTWGTSVPIIILSNYDNSDAQLMQILVDHPSYYLMKADSSLESIVEKIKGILELP